MNIFKVKRKDNEFFVSEGYGMYTSALVTEDERLDCFVRGEGSFKAKPLQTFCIDVPQSHSYVMIKDIFDRFGFYIACDFVKKIRNDCDGYISGYVVIARTAKDPALLDDIERLTDFNFRENADRLICLGYWGFPVFEFDDHLKSKFGYNEEEHGSMADFISMKWGKEFCDRISAQF